VEKIAVLIMICVAGLHAEAQSKLQWSQLKHHIQPDQAIVDSAFGDLDNDKLEDAVMVLVNKKDAAKPKAKRKLVVLLNSRSGLKPLVKGDSVIVTKGCGGTSADPFTALRIGAGDLVITHAGGTSWKWTQTTTFRFDPLRKNMVLLNDEGITFDNKKQDKVMPLIYDKQNFGVVTLDKYVNIYLRSCE
jgi:hypothetical protein